MRRYTNSEFRVSFVYEGNSDLNGGGYILSYYIFIKYTIIYGSLPLVPTINSFMKELLLFF